MFPSDAILRAQFFINSRRYNEAEAQLKQSLAQNPHDAESLNLLAYCCSMQNKNKEAIQHIDNAIALEPSNSRHFYLRSFIKYDESDYKTAESNIQEALRLNPMEPEYFSLLASILNHTARFKEALEAANAGLAIDAENLSCLNARSVALLKLKKPDAAYATIEKALNYDPLDSHTHTTFGFALLENGDSKGSLLHFREALRLNPHNEGARRGIIEAMKSRYLVYRWFLQYGFWLSRLQGRAQWGFIIGLFILIQVIQKAADAFPNVGLFLVPLIYLYGAFVVFTWLIMPISNLFLQFNKFGRLALNSREKWFAILIGILLGVGIASLITSLLIDNALFVYLTIVSVTLCFPVSAMQHIVRPDSYKVMLAVVLLMALVGLSLIVMAGFGRTNGSVFLFYLALTLGSQFLANYYLSKR